MSVLVVELSLVFSVILHVVLLWFHICSSISE